MNITPQQPPRTAATPPPGLNPKNWSRPAQIVGAFTVVLLVAALVNRSHGGSTPLVTPPAAISSDAPVQGSLPVTNDALTAGTQLAAQVATTTVRLTPGVAHPDALLAPLKASLSADVYGQLLAGTAPVAVSIPSKTVVGAPTVVVTSVDQAQLAVTVTLATQPTKPDASTGSAQQSESFQVTLLRADTTSPWQVISLTLAGPSSDPALGSRD